MTVDELIEALQVIQKTNSEKIEVEAVERIGPRDKTNSRKLRFCYIFLNHECNKMTFVLEDTFHPEPNSGLRVITI